MVGFFCWNSLHAGQFATLLIESYLLLAYTFQLYTLLCMSSLWLHCFDTLLLWCWCLLVCTQWETILVWHSISSWKVGFWSASQIFIKNQRIRRDLVHFTKPARSLVPAESICASSSPASTAVLIPSSVAVKSLACATSAAYLPRASYNTLLP